MPFRYMFGMFFTASMFFGVVSADEPQIVRLAITPTVEPVPSLKYQLLPKLIDRRPGNAAVEYERAMLSCHIKDEDDLQLGKWLALGTSDFAAAIKGRDPVKYQSETALEIVRLAARCEHCDWQLPFRDQEFVWIALPDAQDMRRLGRIVAFHARCRIIERKFDEAIQLLQVGYAMARHIAEGPTFVNYLVGLSIARLMDQAMLDWTQASDAPSLYWAVTFRPRPLCDLRPALEAEMYSLELSYPDLAEALGDQHTAEEWNARLTRFLMKFAGLQELIVDIDHGPIMPRTRSTPEKMLEQLQLRAKAVGRAKEIAEFLETCGVSTARIARMSEPQRVLAYSRLKFDEQRDRLFRWTPLPYREGATHLNKAEDRFKKFAETDEELIPLAKLLLPAVASVYRTNALADRRIDTLRIIEALRLYAGKHESKLPTSLDEVTEVPVPMLDVMTGKPFEYTRDGGTARLTLPDENGPGSKRIYEISVAK